MSDVAYNVEAYLKLQGAGAFADGMEKGAKSSDKLGASLKQMKGGVASIATSLADATIAAGTFAVGVGSAGLAAGLALGTKVAVGVGENLSMLENKSIALSSTLAAAASVPFSTAQRAATNLFEQFRSDAVTSAGETADFVNIATKLTGPVLGAGKGMRDLHDLTTSVVAAAGPMNVSFEQAGSDVMRMLQGVAGMEEPLFRAMVGIPSLGIQKAEQFNKLSPEERFKKLSAALGNQAFRDAAVVAGNSLTGLLSTSQDIVKTMGSLAGTPLFSLFKSGLHSLTDAGLGLLKEDDFRVKLQRIGGEFELAFRRIGIQLGRIFPDFNSGANSALDIVTDLAVTGLGKLVEGSKWVADHWGEIKTFAKEARDFITDSAQKAEALVKAIGGGDFTTGAKRIGEALIAVKALEATKPLTGGALDVVKGGYEVGKFANAAWAARGAATGATAAAGAGEAAVAGAGAATAGAGGAGGVAGAISSMAALAGPAGAAALALGGLALAGWQAKELYDQQKGTEGKNADKAAYEARFQESVATGDTTNILAYKDKYLALVSDLSGPGGIAAAETYLETLVTQAETTKITNETLAAANSALMEQASNVEAPIDELVGIYNNATVSGNAALAHMAAETIVNSGKTAADLQTAGLTLAGGLGVFAQNFNGAVGDVKEMFLRFQHLRPAADIKGGAPKASSGGGGTMKVELKVDLGDGNEDAILVKTKRDIGRAMREAKGQVRSGPMPWTRS